MLVPNPVIQGEFELRFLLNGMADEVLWSAYTRAMVVAAGPEGVPGSWSKGWNRLRVKVPAGLANGTHFLHLRAKRDKVVSVGKTLKLVLLR